MGITVPKNIIVTGKYTLEGEYIFSSTQLPYLGYYYELNGKTFAGEEFSSEAPEIVKANSVVTNPNITAYNKITKENPNDFIPITVIYQYDALAQDNINRYFIKKINSYPSLIKEVTKESYLKALSNPLYVAVVLNWNRGGYELNINKVNIAEKIMSGLKEYLITEEETTYPGDDIVQ
jgi:hypothetical protein